MSSFPVSPETFFHRLTTVLPSLYKITSLFFLKIVHDTKFNSFSLTKELHLGGLHGPHATIFKENYCRRWISMSVLNKTGESQVTTSVSLPSVQTSTYMFSNRSYFCLSLPRRFYPNTHSNTSLTIGIEITTESLKHIKFINSNIPTKQVGVTCERCPDPSCVERAASYTNPTDLELLESEITNFIKDLTADKGICYGMHIIANHFKGSVNSSGQRQFGRAFLHIEGQSVLLSSCDRSEVWMSHEKITTSIKSEKAICAISGGVDSAVAAALVSKSIHSNLRCVFVDNGLLRKNEAEQVSDALQTLNLNLTVIKASSTFLTRLKGVADPERKRKIIGKTFIELFESKIKSEKFLIQGTLYPDVIESVNVLGPSQIIKSHHNVGGLPKRMKLKLFEPLRELFKDEVREVGKRLGLPSEILERHPFPGPGLAVRIIGEITKSKLNLLREVDEIFISELRSASLYHHIWQAFAVLLSTKSVGVMGDNRSYENVIALRAVNSIDGMTADWSKLPHDFLATVSTKIVNCVHGVNRVTYDISSKPPATIEWE
ncbi:hypothetical protein CHS0354_023901 [Potamilus streckersoni]|uniref:GMP synthase [glutamine-hydrolyzing] n=1 Tax=Potamilus streckersoni TaxID=2493646 RepID=A0AAE0RZ79_9BIVA|nr:hypothetical protein CHS0354_023901 [Potamilus streckersoni]